MILYPQLNILKDLNEEFLNNKVVSYISTTKYHPQYYRHGMTLNDYMT